MHIMVIELAFNNSLISFAQTFADGSEEESLSRNNGMVYGSKIGVEENASCKSKKEINRSDM